MLTETTEARGEKKPNVAQEEDPSRSDEWSTPATLFAWWHERFNFTIDVAASAENAKCKLYLGKEQDALSLPWGQHRCWMNPPYSRGQLIRWTNHAMLQSIRGATVVCLVPACTDTAWWQRNVWLPSVDVVGVSHGSFWDHELDAMARHWDRLRISVTFLEGRIKFDWGDVQLGAARFPSAVVVYEPGTAYFSGRLDPEQGRVLPPPNQTNGQGPPPSDRALSSRSGGGLSKKKGRGQK